MDAAVAARACRWARFAGRLVSWSSNTTTMRSCLPDERALTWPGLSLEKVGLGTPARAVEPAAQPAPLVAVTTSAAAPSSETTLRGVNDILCLHFPPNRVPISGSDITGRYLCNIR